jgi:predicted metal-dependent hydrolase
MKPEIHKTLTRMAIEHFKSQLPDHIWQNKEKIIEGTKAEDDITLSRLWNWHFYRQKNSPILL